MLVRILCFLGIQLILSSCYTLTQAFRFNDLYNSRQLVSEVLKDESLDSGLRQSLLWASDIISYAEQEGLTTAGAYRYYIHTDQPAVTFLLQAAYPDRLEWLSWWFPIVGRVPYLGYFSSSERDAKAQVLAEKGFDVATAHVGAFSSLGWFEDPIYRPMLLRPVEELAHLLFHELIHRTFWLRGSVQFNENLAEFGAMILAERYLEYKDMPQHWRRYQERRLDRETYRNWLQALRADLQSLYANKELSRQEKLERKSEIFRFHVQENWPSFRTKTYQHLKKRQWNNAYVMGSSLYAPDYSRFEKAFRCTGQPQMGTFLSQVRKAVKIAEEPFAALEQLCLNVK